MGTALTGSYSLPTMTGARRRLLPRGPKGYFLRVNNGLGRGVDEGSSAIAMHHISAAMIAGYQNNIGMTYLLVLPNSDRSIRVPGDHGGVIGKRGRMSRTIMTWRVRPCDEK